ncbi:DUF7427 family protein [Nocardia jiangxiensis]|uniref:DUF7427 family protein n=1 Tax=Nocardia jiangxiensis TaxID=282685 RepID=UPI0002DE068E|nr:hypothetical protein [Nocardia jiangxiensis]
MTIRGWHGWALIIGTVAAVDLIAAIRDNDETLSSAQYRARQRHPVIVRFAIVATTYHLLFGDDETWKRLDIYQLPIAVVRNIRGPATGAQKKVPPAAPPPRRTPAAHPFTHPRPQTGGYDEMRGQNGATLS